MTQAKTWRWWPCVKGDYANDYAQIAEGPRYVARIVLSSVTEDDLRMMVAAPAMAAALKQLVALHDEPAGFAGKYGKALDELVEKRAAAVEAAIAQARAAIAF